MSFLGKLVDAADTKYNLISNEYLNTAAYRSGLLQFAPAGSHPGGAESVDEPDVSGPIPITGDILVLDLYEYDPSTKQYTLSDAQLVFRCTRTDNDHTSSSGGYMSYAYAFEVGIMYPNNNFVPINDTSGSIRLYYDGTSAGDYEYSTHSGTGVVFQQPGELNNGDGKCIGVAAYIGQYRRRIPGVGQKANPYGWLGSYSYGICCYESNLGGFKLKPEIIDDPNIGDDEEGDDGGRSKEGGGDGGKKRSYDAIPIPGLPTVTVAGAGFFTMYKLTQAEMGVFAREVFADDLHSILVNYFANPMDFIAGCAIVPFTPPGQTMYYPKFGLYVWPSQYCKVDNQFVVINCGDITLDKYWGSCFDYSPYTKIRIWLPYIGYKDIDADDVMGQRIHVEYHCDCCSGACVAFISTGVVGETGPQIPRVLAQFSGNCLVQVPTSVGSFDSAVTNAISILTAAAGVALSAGAGGLIGGKELAADVGEHNFIGMASSLENASMNAVVGAKPEVTRNGAPGSTVGYLGVQTPYIIRTIPRQSLPDNYKDLKGYPSNLGGNVGDFPGYLEVMDVRLNNIPATEDETAEIYDLLKGGIIV